MSGRRWSMRATGGYLTVFAVVLGLGAIGTFVFGRSYSELALQREAFDRLSYVPSFDPVEDVTLGLSPNSGNVVATKPDAHIRAIVILPTQTLLLAGGKAVRTIEGAAPASLSELVTRVADQSWISAKGATITMNAAVVAEKGSHLSVAAPVTTELVMTVGPGIFLAATEGSRLDIDGVDVHASDAGTPNTFSTPEAVDGRPFVLAIASNLTVGDSSFRYLGRDWNSSYGLSWSKGSTGYVTGSTFANDFIGVYTNSSNGIRVAHNQFTANSLYGIDPHSGSKNLIVEYNVSNGNGRHGIIFSDHVTDSIVRYNTTIGNGLNGIMMDEASTGNQIYGNTVQDNSSDGIVLADSSDNEITGNTVKGNRIGISVRGQSANALVAHNIVTGNKMAAQGIGLSHNQVARNGGDWSPARIGIVWLAMAGLLLVLAGLTWLAGRGDGHRRRGLGGRQRALGPA
jgi:mannuronan 5-epimerase